MRSHLSLSYTQFPIRDAKMGPDFAEDVWPFLVTSTHAAFFFHNSPPGSSRFAELGENTVCERFRSLPPVKSLPASQQALLKSLSSDGGHMNVFYMFDADEARDFLARWSVRPEIALSASLPLPSVDVAQVVCFCDALIESNQVAVCCGHDGDPVFFFTKGGERPRDLLVGMQGRDPEA
jgi:hypothetical protein